jgi:hypothetical protein
VQEIQRNEVIESRRSWLFVKPWWFVNGPDEVFVAYLICGVFADI